MKTTLFISGMALVSLGGTADAKMLGPGQLSQALRYTAVHARGDRLTRPGHTSRQRGARFRVGQATQWFINKGQITESKVWRGNRVLAKVTDQGQGQRTIRLYSHQGRATMIDLHAGTVTTPSGVSSPLHKGQLSALRRASRYNPRSPLFAR